MIRVILLLSLMIAGCANVREPEPNAPAAVRYVNEATGGEIIFQENWVVIGGIDDGGENRVGDAPRWGAAITQCSDNSYLCLRADRLVFAVPQRALRQGDTYATQGVRFVVDACGDASCAVAEIRAICERFENGRCSLNEPQSEGNDFGTLLKFSYYRAAGVRSIDLFPDTNPSGRRLVLQGSTGILHASWPAR
jgi:hypothetical protein